MLSAKCPLTTAPVELLLPQPTIAVLLPLTTTELLLDTITRFPPTTAMLPAELLPPQPTDPTPI